ncbi:LysR family transcriptional regulator [Aminobacter niigataensis]|uniref:LysR family transcriptional regulator n=1 Tax=Aminobacter niigataensis TaxID=83265 RepID=UPI0024CB7263|nr:LysR family transcriptional regulator [Aminobacter niigataensis]CAI2931853.1 HTH lysR-type domain-containing protein [Aminobacter niigataensis]
MLIEIRHIQAFLAVAAELHFGRAADRLSLAQPALSRTIQNLEEILGVQLLERTTRTVRLTEAGKTFQEHGSRVIHQLNQAIHLTRRTPTGEAGTISVGYVDLLLAGPLSEIMFRYRRQFTDVYVEFAPKSPDDLLSFVSDKQFDCGFALGPIRDSNLDTVCISVEPAVLILPVSHRLSLKTKVFLSDLAREPLVLPPRFGWREFHKSFEQKCHDAGFAPKVAQEVHQTDALFALVAAEIGIGLCPESTSQNQHSGTVAREIADNSIFYETYFVWHRESNSKILNSFIEIASEFSLDKPKLTSNQSISS